MRLDELTIMNDLRERLEQVTETQMMLVNGKLPEPQRGEKVLGNVGPVTQVLWTLGVLLKSERDLEKARSEQVIDPSVSKDHEQHAMIASELEDVTSELCWAQARADLGYWEGNNIGLRKGWELVALPVSQPNGLGKLLGGLTMGLGGGEDESLRRPRALKKRERLSGG